ncbi:hypothetical protein [Nonomuraea gerenzanensis]|uniref:Peptidase M10 metallopeptidase domain-containing protein n=1 Tax=Nonomuraea gerenzanensis TaxID=93944 RepID=A0A1M4EIZ8_9ACTN|nr:hypothetical protein [Nonomuraea gerenzanensis]UBU10360.1 hypothetical protein LCN96_39340 [Nonomuraea gerenzanensis]SBO98754.1 hypothetical protein BN4615_P8270 [Nonomuraea gerenzanensis]
MTDSDARIFKGARWAPVVGTLCLVALGITGAGSASTALADAQDPPSMCFDSPADCTPGDFDNMFPTKNTPWKCRDGVRLYCQTDNSTLTVWHSPTIAPDGWVRIKAVLKKDFDRTTDLKVKFVKKPVYSGPAETDIIYKKPKRWPAGIYGLTWCNDAVDEVKCDQHLVLYKSATPGKIYACHETGHAVGLTHGNNAYPRVSNTDSRLGCMRTPPLTGVDTLGGHNRKMINKTY